MLLMKNNTPKISIIIPVYNGEKTLVDCLDSVFNQTYENYEVVVVDNNSIDNTKKIIETYLNKKNNLKYVFEEKIGRGNARRSGELVSTGDIVLMTDADCILSNDWVEKISIPIIKNEADAVQGSESSLGKDFWSINIQKESERKFRSKSIFLGEGISGMIDTKNFAILRKKLEIVDFTSTDNMRGNDTDLSIKLSKTDTRLLFDSCIVVKHNHPDSFNKVVSKYFWSGYWAARITKENFDCVRNTDFLYKTNQTYYSFFMFFPGLLRTLMFKGVKAFYFDLVTGLSWRIGLVISTVSACFKF